MVRDELLPIGRFARSCRLSVKALRHYDDLGLLRPARVDLATGYRYYRRAQAPAAIAVALLRSLAVPLPAIRELLAADSADAVARLVARQRDRLGREIARAQLAMHALERLMAAGSLLPYEVTTRDEPQRTVLLVEGTTTPERHVDDTHALVRRLLRALARSRLEATGPVMCLLPPAPGDDMILQVCAPVAPPPRARAPRLTRLPGGRVAATIHVGPYEEMGLADHAVHAWVHERGFEPAGPMREVYLDDPATVPPAALRTEVLLPICAPRPRLGAGRTASV